MSLQQEAEYAVTRCRAAGTDLYDVAAKSDIFQIMSQLATQGFGIIFISSELKEVLAMSDRILVMSKGVVTAEFQTGEATEEALVSASAMGHGRTNHRKTASNGSP